jgi:hypothetical protein
LGKLITLKEVKGPINLYFAVKDLGYGYLEVHSKDCFTAMLATAKELDAR